MQQNITILSNALFKESDISKVENDALHHFTERYPYASIGHVLQAYKEQLIPHSKHAHIQHAAMYTPAPNWMYFWMQSPQTAEAPLKSYSEPQPTNDKHIDTLLNGISTVSQESSSSELSFEPYHTIDYFASQGIKISKEDLEKDQFGQQLKRFTDWLKGMKKVPTSFVSEEVSTDNEVTEKVASDAAVSITGSTIDTEAMASVWVKQGKIQQAIHIYQKLSLLNPDKSHYFATKIDNLKSL